MEPAPVDRDSATETRDQDVFRLADCGLLIAAELKPDSNQLLTTEDEPISAQASAD